VPVTSPKTDLSEPRVDVLGMDASSMGNFDELTTASGEVLATGELGANEVYVSTETAEGLSIGVGDRVGAPLVRPNTEPRIGTPSEPESRQRSGAPRGRPGGPGTGGPPSNPAGFEGEGRPPVPTERGRPGRTTGSKAETRSAERPAEFVVAGVYESGANPASDASMVMPLARLQGLVGEKGRVNEVLVTHGGPAVEGGEHTGSTLSAIEPLLAEGDLEAEPVKREAIDGADTRGETFSALFVLFGQFSVAAGMLLIFLIFVMLAAERKKELGIARAVGMRRTGLIRAFALEGALYALAAGVLGSVLGVGVGWVMVRLLGEGFAGGEGGLRISFAASPGDVVLAFCVGMVLTFIVVLLSSWRVSRLNVVRAVRDIPEPDREGSTLWGVLVAGLLPLAGAVAFWRGLATETMAFYLGGISLVLIGGRSWRALSACPIV
jgi:hypothetical protein